MSDKTLQIQRNETQHSLGFVGFRSSTQPTIIFANAVVQIIVKRMSIIILYKYPTLYLFRHTPLTIIHV
ncbi:hypothetical protein [Nostoc favosum]|uniref:Uncharacterized protein n=1 Tax=Nostoc favosum CHAB5714 TaxID=2780399 RepID=A0ABS8IDC5_9NOSO|nr:hypothetical protein [Nostoc favosum]MCC5602213.1 hypothetical protein [Nostoc favosum CHAB5714]